MSPSIKNIIDNMQQLSEEEQRSLAGAILNDRKLEAFVEELDDCLSCEKAVAEGLPECFKLNKPHSHPAQPNLAALTYLEPVNAHHQEMCRLIC